MKAPNDIAAKAFGRKRVVKIWLAVIVYFGVTMTLWTRAQTSTDKRYGWQMFSQSSRYHPELVRVLKDGSRVNTDNGRWTAYGPDGVVRSEFDWDDHVKDFRLDKLGSWKRAKGSLERTLKFQGRALSYVADHIPEDAETVQLVMEVEYRKAGGPLQTIELLSKKRKLAP
jgi:hypothetical protein